MRKKSWFTKAAVSTMAVCMIGGTVLPGVAPMNVQAEDSETEDTGAADSGAAEWNEIQSIVSRYYGEWKDTTYSGLFTDKMPNTALLGNGDVGVVSGGNDESKTFYVSKSDFWTYGTGSYSSPCPPIPIGGVTIEKQKKQSVVEESENLAPTNISVTASSHHDDFTPEKAVNGEMQENPNGYGWVTKRPQDAEQKGNKQFWLQLEFEEAISIARYVVKSDGAVRAAGAENNTKDFELQISETGEEDSWTSADTVSGNALGVYDKNLNEPVTAKFVRLLITTPTQEATDDAKNNPRARIGQFELYAKAKTSEEIPEESANLVLNKPITVSGYINNPGTVYHSPGEMLVDGDSGSKWCATPKENIDGSSTYWAMIDLGAEKEISRWVLKHAQAGGEDSNYNTRDFKLQYSTRELPDGALDEDWIDADVVEENTAGTTDRNLKTSISTRYIRLVVTKPTQDSNTAVRLYELEVYKETKASSVPFYEKQDILNAEIQTTQELADVPTEMKTWLSADQNIMVTELKSNGEQDADFQVGTWASANDKANKPVTAENDENSITVTRSTKNTAPTNPNAHVSKSAMSTKIIGADNVAVSSNDASGKGELKFTLGAGQTVYVVTSVGGGGRNYHSDGSLWDGAKEPIADAKEVLAGVSDENGVSELNASRQAWWKDFWSASYVNFGTEDEKLNKVQKYYYGAQYILGSTSKEGELAPGLYGIWHTTDNASWSSDYHLNYNFISTFYGTNSSNRPEIALPGVQVLLDYVPEGQRRASSIDELRRINKDFVDKKVEKGDISEENGIPGAILFPVGIAPWGMTTDNVYLNEALDATYNSYLMSQYYDYTLDKEFLENGVYDYMKQAVAFYEAWLEKEDKGDSYEYVLYAGYNEGSWAINPAVELAALKNTLRHLISSSEALGRDADKRETWIDIYEHLGDQPTTLVNGKKVLALGEKQWLGGQWVDLPNPIPGDGNAIPLDAVIPGGVYNYFSTAEDLQIVQDTIDVFSARGAWGQINNFPRLFPEAVKSRYPIDTVVTKLVDVINGQMASNLRINDNTHGVEKCGSTETINSMMLISEDGMNKIFPNWYTDKNAKFSNLRAKGAFTVSAEYDGTAQEAKNVVINSEKGQPMTLVTPWAEGATVRDSAGNVVKTTAGTVPNWGDEKTITFDTKAGETYTVEKGEAPVELDYEAIDKVIAEAEAIQQDGYTAESYQALQDALNNAKDARQNATTQDELNEKKDALRTAIAGLRGSKTILKTFLNKAKQHVADGDVDGLVESVQKLFAEAIAEGEAVMSKEDATKEEVLKASVKLMKAIQSLVFKAGDKADLGMALELTTMIDLSKYVEAGQAEYLAAKAAAEAVMANDEAMQPEVDAAWNKLVDTMMELRSKADKSTLEDLLKSVKDLDLSKYTEESVKVYAEALAFAEGIMADANLSIDDQKKVDDAVVTLMAAKDGLKEKQGSGNGGNGGSQDKPNGDGNQGSNGNGADKNKPPVKGTIKTGDTSSLVMPILAIMLSMGAVITIGVTAVRRKRK